MENSVSFYIGYSSPAKVFIDYSELSDSEREVISKMADNWVYGKQVILQEEFVKKDQSKQS